MGSFFSSNKQEQEQAGYQVGQQLATTAVPKVNYNTANQFENSHTGWQGGQQGTVGTSIPQGPEAINNGSATMKYQPTQSAVMPQAVENKPSIMDNIMGGFSKISVQQQQAQPMQLARTGARGYNPIQGFGSVNQTGRW